MEIGADQLSALSQRAGWETAPERVSHWDMTRLIPPPEGSSHAT